MKRILVSWLLVACAASALAAEQNVTAPEAQQQDAKSYYQTKRTLAALQKCLTEKLTERGDVKAVPIGNTVTLMYEDGASAPMLIDLEPPLVTVTTQFSFGTRKVVENCL